ncbi:acyl-CoA dehydrogenase [Desulfosporosinus acidiphilus SJ4]|uniref:Acyl-CoA dehydrogenase n=1 Tax=Desulfosporosinus acidiphilus (strain DSM 22704 / JCM 16185 / SJ4) TaxID=646529 RepID=I4D347_DESAJ|nr:acyl-CoA dehydrogenase family protein [Desulfosporosinus acidiphilus]AFM40221.1 acyl-CoA dehydrogenase [Desulfosporosinus acidiphilus SJ4]
MNFELSEEQKAFQNLAYKFALKEFEPLAKECDREEKYPRELWQKACEAGLVGIAIPEEYGGPGGGWMETALITEQLSRIDMGLGLAVMAATFGSENILNYGTEEQKKKYLSLLPTGQAIFAGAYTEPNAGSDVAGTTTKAVKDGSDYVINGSKMFITNGTICDYMVALCVTNPDTPKKTGRHSLIIVDANTPGITRTKIKGKMGIRASDTAEINFEDVRVPQENLVGKEGNGFHQLMHFFDMTRIMVASQGLGLAQGALDLALKYVQERKTFGFPLAANQAIQFQLAEMAMRIELARNIIYKAAWKADNGQLDPSLNAMAKYYAGETAVWVTDKALQMHGGYGYIDEYDIQRFYRDAKILEIYEGAKEIEKITIAKRLF